MRRWQWALQLLTRRMWFRAGLFCVFAVALALASAYAGHLISYDLAAKIGSKSVDAILNLLASSMLAVTTFSLAAMVQAYSGATSTITPRAVQLLVDDSTSQNALATFLGSFLFAIVGIIALSTGIYGETGRVILFGGTILVIGLIVITLLRWIEHVTRFGRMADTIARVEKAAARSVRGMTQRLSFAAFDTERPADAALVHHTELGRITHVDLTELSDVAEATGASLHVLSLPGMLADPAHPLVWTKASLDEQQVEQVREAFTIQHDRAFDNDPRFALVVLGEIASRALSPAVNDPGTAIAVIEAGTRVLATMMRHEPDQKPADTAGVIVPRIAFPDLVEDLFRPIARDGAALIEVGIRLQKALAALSAIEPQSTARCRAEAADALSRASAAFTSSADAAALTRLHEQLWPQEA